MHRGYHVLAVPTWERKVRVLAVWATAVLFGRDIVSLAAVQHPRKAFLAGAGPGVPASAQPPPSPPGPDGRAHSQVRSSAGRLPAVR
jgi:NADH dehydrogenase